MNLGSKLGWVNMPPSFVEYPGSDKRNRNPNWTDTEIARFLTILMEEPVLADLNAQRNKQVFCYVSQKMAGEGCEKSWDQCRVKLKNLKSQWRYVKDRIPGIETADLDDEDVVRQLGQDCQTRGVSPSCIKHLRLLKQFLVSLAAVRKGLSPPTFKSETFNFAAALEVDKSHGVLTRYPSTETSRVDIKSEEVGDEEDSSDARLIVETGISPPTSPGLSAVTIVDDSEASDADHIVLHGPNPLNVGQKRKAEEGEGQCKRLATDSSNDSIDIVQRFQKEMMTKYLQFQRESELRQLAWDQERWRMEQSMMERWRTERRAQDKEMFNMMCSVMSDFTAAILEHKSNKASQ